MKLNLTNKLHGQIATCTELFQNKEGNDSGGFFFFFFFFKIRSTFPLTQNRDRDLDHQIDVLNSLNLEEKETKYESHLSNMEPKDFSKLSNDETTIVKFADEREAVVILSPGHYQSTIME